MKVISLTAAIMVLICFAAKAETYQLDLESSIAVAKIKSYDMLKLQQDLKIAGYKLKSATSSLRTSVNMELTTPEYTETIKEFEDTVGISFYSINRMKYYGSLKINQPLPTDGSLYLQTSLSNTDDLNNDKRLMNLCTRLGLTQPIDALYGYNNIKSELRQAELYYEQTQKELKREELNLIYEVSDSFYDLLSKQKSREIAQTNLDRQTEAFNLAKNKYDAGLIREVDALQMEVDLAEAQNNYDIASIDLSSAENEFKELIGINISDSVVISSNLDYVPVTIDSKQAVALALQNRLEIREQEIQVEINKMNLKKQKAEGMIKGELTAYYEKNGISELGIDEGIETSLSNSANDFGARPQNFGVGLTLHIPIIDWGKNRALVRSAEAQMQKSIYQQEIEKRKIEREVLNLVNEISNSLKRLLLLEKNVVVAEKSFSITLSRFSDGDIVSQDLALERERLNNAHISYLTSYINYKLKLADLMRKTFYDFQNNRSVL